MFYYYKFLSNLNRVFSVNKLKSIVLFFVFVFSMSNSWGQTRETIWAEDFQGCSEGDRTGTGEGVSDASWSVTGSNIYVEKNRRFRYIVSKGRNRENKFLTSNIDIEGYTNISISFDALGEGFDYGNRYFKAQYSIDNGGWITFLNKSSIPIERVFDVANLSGSNLKLRFLMNNGNQGHIYYLDDIIVKGVVPRPKVSLSVSPSSILENGGQATVTATLDRAANKRVNVDLKYLGSADISDDYSGTRTILIPRGETSASITITARDDQEVEGDENIHVSIGYVDNADKGDVQSVDITIVDDDFPPKTIAVDQKYPEKEYDYKQLVKDVLITGCLKAYDIKYKGDSGNGIGYFEAGESDFPLSSGIVMSNGDVANAVGPNRGEDQGDQLTGYDFDPDYRDSDLMTLAGTYKDFWRWYQGYYDAQVLEFDFVPAGNKLEFKYIFASEEYPDYACTKFNDGFAFILSGDGITNDPGLSGKNIAIIPNTLDKPVTINNVNGSGTCGSSQHYVDETNGDATCFNGRTKVLTATADVTKCLTYHIKLIIYDNSDHAVNSAVFLEAKSFSSNETIIQNGLGAEQGDKEMMYEGCEGSYIRFTRKDNIDKPYSFGITLGGTAKNGEDYVCIDESGQQKPFPSIVSFDAGEASVEYDYIALTDDVIESDETFSISFLKDCPCDPDPVYYSKEIRIIDVPQIEASAQSNVRCKEGSPVATIGVKLKEGLIVDNYEYSMDNVNFQDEYTFTLNNPIEGDIYTIYVRDKYHCGDSQSITATIPEVTNIKAFVGDPINMCEGSGSEMKGGGGIFYEWNCVPGDGTIYLTDRFDPTTHIKDNIPYGDYQYTLTAKESSGTSAVCVSTATVNVKVNKSPKFSVEADRYEVCSGQSITLTGILNNEPGDVSYLWASDEGSLTGNTAVKTVIPESDIQVPKTYTLTMSSNGCDVSKNVAPITVNPNPEIRLNTENCIFCAGENDGRLEIVVNGGTPNSSEPFYEYVWDDPLKQITPVIDMIPSGTYKVTATDVKGCKDSKSFNVKNKPNPAGVYHD